MVIDTGKDSTSETQIEAIIDLDLERRDKDRKGIGEIFASMFGLSSEEALSRIKSSETFSTPTVSDCGFLGVGHLGSGFTFRLKDKPDDWKVLKVATYYNDPWLDPEKHVAVGTTGPITAIPSFAREVSALLRFQNLPPAPKLYDFGVLHIQGKDRPFIVEEEIIGKTLADEENPLRQEERARLIFQYLLQLNYLHNRGFVMPDNHIFSEVVYLRDTKPPSIKIFDFELIQPADTDYQPKGDLDRLKDDLYDTGNINTKRLHERLALIGESIVTKEFDEKFAHGEIKTAGAGLLPIAQEYPQVAEEIGENWYRLKGSKPALSYNPGLVQKLMQSRHIHIS